MPGDLSAAFPNAPVDLYGPLLKAARAEELARDLIQRLDTWRAGPCYRLESEPHPEDTNRVTATVANLGKLPHEVPVVLGEIVYLLGSALDQLICALMRRQGKSCSHSYFPIRDTEEKFEKALDELRSLASSDMATLRRLRAFKDGDRLLWAIRELTNRDKHEFLLAVAATSQVRFGGQARTPSGDVIPGLCVEGWNASEPLSRLVVGDTFDFPKPSEFLEARLQVFVAFDEPEIFGSDLVVTGSFNLRAIQRVRGVIGMFCRNHP
jgi:hypothetical protein